MTSTETFECECCAPKCCCTVDANGVPALTDGFPTCDGTLTSNVGAGCAGASITIAWCGLEVSATVVPLEDGFFDIEWDWLATCTPPPYDPDGQCTEFTSLALYPAGDTEGFYVGCNNNCIVYLYVNLYQCGDVLDGLVVYREGCDDDPEWIPLPLAPGFDGELCACGEQEPVITFTYAP
jgi:hypothetical protein